MTNPSEIPPEGLTEVLITQQAARLCPFSRKELHRILRAMLGAAGRPDGILELNIISDATMEELNNDAMGCRGPTNILSFPAAASGTALSPATHDLGWLALSAETLHRECLLYGQEPHEHAIRLLAHGIAHLLGLDHSEEMDKLTEELILAGMQATEI